MTSIRYIIAEFPTFRILVDSSKQIAAVEQAITDAVIFNHTVSELLRAAKLNGAYIEPRDRK